MGVYLRSSFIQEIPPNPWNDIDHYSKLKAEPEIKELFEKYSEQLDKWHRLFIERENDFFHQQKELAEIIKNPFEKAGLIDAHGSIPLHKNESITPENWLHTFRLVIFDPTLRDAGTFYEKLMDFSIKTKNGHQKWLENFNNKSDVFRYMVKILPDLRTKFKTEVTDEDLHNQRMIIQDLIEKLKTVLETKLK